MYEYYSPYVKITTKDWDEVLLESIPNVATAQDYRSYVLAIAQVTAMTGDAHMTLTDKYGILRSYYGNYYLPCSILIIDGQAVVEQTAHTENQLLPGDILLEIDGMPVESRIRELSQYLVLPQPDKILKKLGDSLLQTKGTSAEIVVLRNHKMISLQVTTDINAYSYQNPFKNGFLNEENIGYIDPSALKEGDLEKLMDKFRDTKGIVVDLRYYPSVFIPYLLGEYIVPTPTEFAKLSTPNPGIPGAFFQQLLFTGKGTMKEMNHTDKTFDEYTGKIVLLIDERSSSQSEFTTMALRQSPNAVVVGSPSLGADGDRVKLSLPGQLTFYMSGLGVYTPDNEQTQRCGLSPDIECRPTIEDLQSGRDELIEKAVEIINTNE